MIDYSKLSQKMVDCLSEYIEDNNLKSICIGISGGIDSTISACLASKACERCGVPLIGRSLPTITNKPEENNIANLVGKAFCSDFKVSNISEECQKLIYKFELKEGKMTLLQEGNIKARVRMIYLRHLASIHKGIVLDNDNFSEWNLGFWTQAGDSPMDYNMGLHYLWKTEIYELAKYLLLCYDDGVDEEKFQAIRASINLIPTDGNGISSSDCEQFGLDNYEQVDDVLKTIYYRKDSDVKYYDKQYIRLINSYNEQGVDKVMMLHQNTEYKRKPQPICPTKEELGL